MTKQKGWTLQHPKYGKWFLPYEAVVEDWKKDYREYYKKEPEEPDESTIQTWYHEQFGWCEVYHYGKQLEKPDMQAWEIFFLSQMKKDTDYITKDEEEE